MAEHHLPELDQIVSDFASDFNTVMDEHLRNLADMRAAIRAHPHDPVAIVDDWEARRLLRHLPADVIEN